MKEKIQTDYISAFKNKDTLTKDVLSLVKGAIQNAEINKKEDLTDDEIISIIEKQIKMRNDAVVEFEKAGRTTLVEQYNNEIKILEKYMPEKLSNDEINSIIEETINDVKPEGMKDFGRIMKEITPKLKGRADISSVSTIIKSKLN